jgi:putative mRNA 3-end processing factor
MARGDVLVPSAAGWYCPAGDFYIDPQRPVARAVITHAHADHARPGCSTYYCAAIGAPLLALRVGVRADIRPVAWREPLALGRTEISFHPSGHMLGAAQIRVAASDQVWVITGDHNYGAVDPSCDPFEVVRCDVFITESTFALPIFRWPDPAAVFADIHHWWRSCQQRGVTCVIPAYPLGKTQRLLASLDPACGPLAIEGSGADYLPTYRAARGGPGWDCERMTQADVARVKGRGLVLYSGAAARPAWWEQLAPYAVARASGWMATWKARRGGREPLARGFVLSDHADWPGLLASIDASGARRIGVTHGQVDAFVRHLRAAGFDAFGG